MTYLLDTSAFSALMRHDARCRAHLSSLAPTDRLVVCTITAGEIFYGIERLPTGKRRRALAAEAATLFAQFPCLPVPEAAAAHYAHVKREAERQGTPLDENDLWIAATALATGAVVVTSDADFDRIPGFAVENWSA